jgi:citrate synthase
MPNSKKVNRPNYQSAIWLEEPELDNPFAAKNSYCYGYNVYRDILPKASLSEYWYLLLTGERASSIQAKLLEKIAIAVANPGMRDESIRAAMNAGVGGSTAAASLIAALGVGAGQYGGAREVFTLVEQWHKLGCNLTAWQNFLQNPNQDYTRIDIWSKYEHAPGFEPNGDSCPTPILQSLTHLASLIPDGTTAWLNNNRIKMEQLVTYPLSMTGVIASAMFDLALTAKQAEMLFLILRLPGAAIHALEQEQLGWKKFPFFGQNTTLTDDPGPMGMPTIEGIDL